MMCVPEIAEMLESFRVALQHSLEFRRIIEVSPVQIKVWCVGGKSVFTTYNIIRSHQPYAHVLQQSIWYVNKHDHEEKSK